MSKKLKRCPFCGGKAVLMTGMGEHWCQCGCQKMHSTEDRAITAWNTRINCVAAVARINYLESRVIKLEDETCNQHDELVRYLGMCYQGHLLNKADHLAITALLPKDKAKAGAKVAKKEVFETKLEIQPIKRDKL